MYSHSFKGAIMQKVKYVLVAVIVALSLVTGVRLVPPEQLLWLLNEPAALSSVQGKL